MHADDASLDVARFRDAVQWYFGDLIADVARTHPVTQSELTDGLARIAAVAEEFVDRPGSVVTHRGADEMILVLAPFRWRRLVTEANLDSSTTVACRSVHAKMAEAFGVSPDSAVPVVRIDPDHSREDPSR